MVYVSHTICTLLPIEVKYTPTAYPMFAYEISLHHFKIRKIFKVYIGKKVSKILWLSYENKLFSKHPEVLAWCGGSPSYLDVVVLKPRSGESIL